MKNTLILEKTFLEFSYLAQILFTTTETELIIITKKWMYQLPHE